MAKEKFVTIPQLAEMLGISRIAVYKKVKSGQILAKKIGRNYVISDRDITNTLRKAVTAGEKRQVDTAVRKAVKEYGEALKRLGKE